MTQKLTSSVLRVGELNLAGYQRPSKASPEVLQALGLNPDDENLVRIGSASVQEVVLLETTYDRVKQEFELQQGGSSVGCYSGP